ncbi:DUF4347 domain-containing protein [Meridianimarinicoccus sp. RP-17]|uniref:DUF4347 domain-containing protein n=1 Tax=Meridianimarinicoccus zhengii TaxID=2056810 RepID=UPI0013A6C912|nr:DUF4347 domain-containing protein [Phycocomes zhengii]
MTSPTIDTSAMARTQREIAVFAPDVPDRQVLMDGLRAGIIPVALPGSDDGLADLAALLAGVRGLDALHVFSHGAPGRLFLGTVPVTAQTLAANGPLLAKIGSALAPEGKVVLYGCEVAKGAEGRAFVAALEAALWREVAASETPTGAAALGGDWRLADAFGADVDPAIRPAAQQQYTGLLAPYPYTYTVTNNNLSGEGSLGYAIEHSGADRIEFSEGFTIDLDGSSIVNTLPYITRSLVIDGDVDNDGVADVTLTDGDSTNTVSALVLDGYHIDVTIEGIVFQGLSSTQDGTAIRFSGDSQSSTLNVEASEFRDLTSTEKFVPETGGAITAGSFNTVNVDRSIFTNVTQTGDGAVIGMNMNSTINLTNSLFYENTVGSGVVVAGYNGSITLRNVTAADNSIATTYLSSSGSASVYNSVIESGTTVGYDSTYLFAGDDLFADAANDDYRPAEGSLLIDNFLSNNGEVSGTLDLAGADRIQNGTVDFGAYEGAAVAPNAAPVFDGDSDDDGTIDTALTVTEDSGATSLDDILGVTDADTGDTLTWSIVSGPNGTLGGFDSATGSATGSSVTPSGLTYTPDPDYNGSDSFVVQVSDGTDTDTMTVNVTVEGAPDVDYIEVIPDSHGIGDPIYAVVAFDQAMQLDTELGSPTLTLDIGGTLREATLLIFDVNKLGFSYTVTADDSDDADGITVPANALSLNGATITGTDGQPANITHDAVAAASATVSIAPTVTVTVDDDALIAGETATVTFEFSEAVTDFTLDDATAANGTLSGLLKMGATTYIAVLTPDADTEVATNVVTVDMTGVRDTADNAGTGTTDSATYAVDTRAPTAVSIVRHAPADATTDADSVTFRVTFSEDMDPAKVGAADFVLSGTAAADATIGDPVQVSGAPAAYDVTITGIAASNGTLNLDLADGATLLDAAGNSLAVTAVSGADETYTIANNTAPAVSTNTGATLDEGASLTITAAELKAIDAEEAAAALSFKLGTTTANGALWLDDGDDTLEKGEELIAGESFTQADIENGRLRYSHGGSETTADSFSFTVSDGIATLDPLTFNLSINPVNDLPTGGVTISGTAAQGETLTAAHDLGDADGLGDLAWQWRRDGAAIDGATGPSHTLTQADVGAKITVVASYTDDGGTAESVGSEPTAAVADVNDAPTVALSNAVTEIGEHTDTTSRVKLADIEVGDDALGTNALTLGGADAAMFEIQGAALYLRAGAVLDPVAKPVFDVTVSVDDATIGATPDDTVTFSLKVKDINDPPSLTLEMLLDRIAGGIDTTTAVAVARLGITDDAMGANDLSLSGADAGIFAIEGDTLVIARDAKVEFGDDGLIEVEVRLDDPALGAGPEDTARVVVQELGSSGGELSGGTGKDTLVGGDGNDMIAPGTGSDRISLGGGADHVGGAADDLDGDRIVGFGNDDAISVSGMVFTREDLQVSATVDGLDLRIDGSKYLRPDTVLHLDGSFDAGDFMAVRTGDDVEITFAHFLPTLAEGQNVDPQGINGIVNQKFLNGDMARDFDIEFLDLGYAGYDNVIGAYEITSDGAIVDVQILSFNANADKGGAARIEDVDPGNALAFFIAQDAAGALAGFDATDTFDFVDLEGGSAGLDDGAGILLRANGTVITAPVYHSYSTSQNADGVQHVLSGVEEGGQSIVVGFEDMTGGGDRDYEDVAFRILAADSFLLG